MKEEKGMKVWPGRGCGLCPSQTRSSVHRVEGRGISMSSWLGGSWDWGGGWKWRERGGGGLGIVLEGGSISWESVRTHLWCRMTSTLYFQKIGSAPNLGVFSSGVLRIHISAYSCLTLDETSPRPVARERVFPVLFKVFLAGIRIKLTFVRLRGENKI